MNVDESKEIILSWDTMLSERMKKYIHYRSMKNFVIHFDEIDNKVTQEKIIDLLSSYVREIVEHNYFYDRTESYALAKGYLRRIADYYREMLGFKRKVDLPMVIIGGFMADSLLYLIG